MVDSVEQLVTIPFDRGLDSDTEVKTSRGNFVAEDVLFTNEGVAVKRPGWRNQDVDDLHDARNLRGQNSLETVQAYIMRRGNSIFDKDGEPLLLAEDKRSSGVLNVKAGWSQFLRQSNTDGATAKWSALGEFRPTVVTAKTIAPRAKKDSFVGIVRSESVRVGNYTFYLYQAQDSGGITRLYYLVADTKTNEIIESEEIDSSSVVGQVAPLAMVHRSNGEETAIFASFIPVGTDVRVHTWNVTNGFDSSSKASNAAVGLTEDEIDGRAIQKPDNTVPQTSDLSYAIAYKTDATHFQFMVFDGDRTQQKSTTPVGGLPISIGIVPLKGRGTYRSYVGVVVKQTAGATATHDYKSFVMDTNTAMTTVVASKINAITNPTPGAVATTGHTITGAGERGDSDIEIRDFPPAPADVYARVALGWGEQVGTISSFIRFYIFDDDGTITDLTGTQGIEEDLGNTVVVSQLTMVDRRLFIVLTKETESALLTPGAILYEFRAGVLSGVNSLYNPQVQLLPYAAEFNGSITRGTLVSLQNIADESIFFGTKIPILIKDPSSNGKSTDILASIQVDVAGTAMLPAQSVVSDGQMFIAQGALVQVDQEATELGFWGDLGIGVSLTDQGGNNSLVDTKVYGFSALQEWIDGGGRIHRGRPLPSVSLTAAAPALGPRYLIANRAGISVRGTATPSLTPEGKGTDTRVFTYRTEADGPLHRFIAQEGAQPFFINNNKHDDFQTLLPAAVDADIDDNEILYTESGEQENRAPPACNIITVVKNRVFLVSSEDPTLIWFSKERIDGVGLSFTTTFTLRVSDGGDITGLAELNGDLVVFKKRAIFIIGGNGPDVTGQGAFALPRRIHSSIGCVHRNSVVDFQGGIFFKSDRGFQVIDHSWRLSYVGQKVTASDAKGVRRAIDMPKDSSIFVLQEADGTEDLLVWNYLRDRWSTLDPDTDGVPSDIANVDNVVYVVGTNGKVVSLDGVEGDATYKNHRMRVSSPWINLAGISGYQRIKWLELRIESSTNIFSINANVKLRYDYIDSPPVIETHAISFKNTVDNVFRIKPGQQKCAAIRVEIDESNNSNTGVSVAPMQLMVVIKDGKLQPQAPAQTT